MKRNGKKGIVKKPPFDIERNSGKSLSGQVEDGLRNAIACGYYREGDLLPSIDEIGNWLKVSRIIVRRVVRRLADEGLVIPRRHIGTLVSPKGMKIWRGHVILLIPDVAGAYYANIFADTFREKLSAAGYSFTRITMAKRANGQFDFAQLDAELNRHVDLTVLFHGAIGIERHLSRAMAPFAVVGGAKGKMRQSPMCVGHVLRPRSAALPDLLLHCSSRDVKRVLQIGWDQDDARITAGINPKGIAFDRWIISPASGAVHPEDVQRGAMKAVSERLAGGRGWLPDVLFLSDDVLANGVLMALLANGVRIPEDVRVVTWAHRGNGPVFVKSLTRMEMDSEAHGGIVADCAISYLRGRGFPEGIELRPTYIKGESFP